MAARKLGWWIGVGLLLVGPPTARGQDLWAIDDFNDTLYRINVNTLTATAVGTMSVTWSFGGIAFGANGTLYGWNGFAPFKGLYTINQTTAVATPVFAFSGGPDLETIDINPLNGRTFGIPNVNAGAGLVHEVNLATGAAVAGPALAPAIQVRGSAFSPTGTWYGIGNGALLHTVNPLTGTTALVGALGQPLEGVNLAYNPADNFLYSIRINHFQTPLYRIDPGTGIATLVGNLTGIVGGSDSQITASTFQIAAVPEPATALLLGLAGVGTGLGIWHRRRSRIAEADLEA